VVAIGFTDWPWWQRLLAPVVIVPLLWWWALRHAVYRVELVGDELRLRALLGAWRVPLGELAAIGRPSNRGLVSVKRRDGRSWTVLGGSGWVAFADAVGAAAPQARVGLTKWQRMMDQPGG
jgi:hypothetical protein